MPLTQAQGLLLSNDWLMRRFVEDSPFVIQLSYRFPWFEVWGDSERWSTTPALLTAKPIGFCSPLPEQTTVPQSRSYSYGHIATRRDVCYSTQDLQSNVNDQSVAQLEMACRNILYEIWREFIAGNPAITPGEMLGVDAIINQAAFAGQIIDAAGGALTTKLLDQALRRIGQGDGWADAVYTGPDGYNAIRQAFLSQGSLPQQQALLVPDGNGGTKTMWTTYVDGVPVYWSDFVPIEVFQNVRVQKIWFFKFGQRHVHGIIPSSIGRRSMIKIRSTIIDGAIRYDATFAGGISVPSVKDIAVIKNVAI